MGPETRTAILGFGVEGRAVLDYLLSLGCRDITVCDKEEALELPAGVKSHLGDDYLEALASFEVVFRSPGVPRDLASISDAEGQGTVVTSATKEFFRCCPCAIVGITGSNGKTTTTELIARILRTLFGENLHVGGNDRRPLLSELPRIARDHVAVLELSSFQLADLERSPHVAVVLNITPNHLDVHRDLQDYATAKSQIVRHQSAVDHAVLNWSFGSVREMAKLTAGRVVKLNLTDCETGAFLREGRVVVRTGEGDEILAPVGDLPSFLNVDNVLAAASVGRLFGVGIDTIRTVVENYKGFEHRLELVRELDGVRYYDDSASTTPESAINALHAFAEGTVVLIAGGTDKRLSYDALAKELVRTRARTLLIGTTRERIAAAVRDNAVRLKQEPHVLTFETLESAVAAARDHARSGDVVVLSPGCASFDMFRNAKHRGEVFRRLVSGLH